MTKIAISVLAFAAVAAGQTEVVTTGLQAPQKVIVAPGGNLLVTETSTAANSGRVSIVTPSGARRSLLEGLPSGTDTVGSASGPTGMALRNNTLYLALGGGDAERMGTTPGVPVHNPQGKSSALFGSVLVIRSTTDLANATGPFQMTTAHQDVIRDGGEVRIEDGSGGAITVSALVRFPISEPDPNTVYRFSNLWGLELTEDGNTLYVVDASMNTVVRVATATGRWERILRFPPLANPTPVGPPMIDAVPTSVRIYGSELLISFLTGFPFVPGSATVRVADPSQRTSHPFIYGLSSATDVVWRPTSGPRAQFFTLEFSQNQAATPPAPGRLLRYDTQDAQVVAADLQAPVSLALDSSSNALYVLELTGRLLRVRLN